MDDLDYLRINKLSVRNAVIGHYERKLARGFMNFQFTSLGRKFVGESAYLYFQYNRHKVVHFRFYDPPMMLVCTRDGHDYKSFKLDWSVFEKVVQEHQLEIITLLDTQINDLEWSTRLIALMHQHEIFTLRDLVGKTEKEISSIKGIGHKSLWEITEFLQYKDLEFGMKISN